MCETIQKVDSAWGLKKNSTAYCPQLLTRYTSSQRCRVVRTQSNHVGATRIGFGDIISPIDTWGAFPIKVTATRR
jgi:hypothetical protein